MLVAWSSSEKLRLLLLHKEGVKWPAVAEKLNEEYRERPKNFFNEKNCKAEFDRIFNEPCPKSISTDEPSQSFKKATVIEAWISDLKEKVRLDTDKMVETALVDMRKKTQLIENLMSKDNRPPHHEMVAMLAQIKEENKKRNRNPSEMEKVERVESTLRARFNQIFKEQRESSGDADNTVPRGSLSISPTKASSVALQNAFRSPSPIKSPIASPIKSPMTPPVKSPMASPIKSPISSPIKSPITSPIRSLAEAIEEADAEMGELMEMGGGMDEIPEMVDNEIVETAEEPKMEVETPVASPLSPIVSHSSSGKKNKERSVSPRTAADRAIGEGGLEEEMEEEEEVEEEVKEEENMEVDEKEEETEPVVEEKKEEKPVVTRKSTRVSSMSGETTPASTTPVREKKKKDPSPAESSTSKKEEKEKEKEKEKAKEKVEVKEKKEVKEEEQPARRASMRGRPPSTPVVHAAPSSVEEEEKEKEEETPRTRRSSRVEKVEEKKEDKKEEKKEKKKEEVKKEEKEEEKEEEGAKKRITRRSMVEKEGEKTEEKEKEKDKVKDKEKEKEVKEEVTFVAPSVASRTRHHRGSEQTEDKEKEKEKSEEPTVSRTRSSGRHSVSGRTTPESKESPAPEKKTRGKEKKEESEEKEIRGGKETSVANSEKSSSGNGGKRDAEVLTEISIRHPITPPAPVSPSKTRRGTERESPVARKASRASVCSSTSGKISMSTVEVQTEKVEMKHEDVVHVFYNANEKYFNPSYEVRDGRGRPKKDKEKEIKTEAEEEKPISRRTRGGEMSEDEGGSRSGSFSQSDKGTPSRRKERTHSVKDLMTIRLDVDDDTGRYWLAHNDASHVELFEGPPSAKKRSMVAEISHRRSMAQMEPLKGALYKACKDLELHRHSSVFKANVPHKDAPDYYECVYQPMSIAKLKNEVQEGKVNDPVSLQRKLAIMFMNGAMYNSTGHDYWTYAVEMNKETYRPIREIMPEMLVEEEEIPKQTRARRNNEPAFLKDAVLCDRDRSSTHDRSFKCESVDAEELHVETSADDHRALYTRTKVDSTRKRKL